MNIRKVTLKNLMSPLMEAQKNNLTTVKSSENGLSPNQRLRFRFKL